ncbi:PFDN5 (predicted) [Pycnogonum litorale]
MASTKGVQTVELSSLNIQQLSALKQQVDQELELFSNSLQQLKIAQQRFQESVECVSKLNDDTVGKEILVPLTGSMYVPGQINDSSNVIVDVGTGYYTEKTIEAAKKYFHRKVTFVTEQMEKIQAIAQEKNQQRLAVTDILESKCQAQMAQQTTPAKS